MMKKGSKKCDFQSSKGDDDSTNIAPVPSQSTDPFWNDVICLNFDYLSYAGGITSAAPGNVRCANVEMWNLDQIYKLRSEVLELSMVIDKRDEIIQEQIKNGFETIVESLEEMEASEPLKISSISFEKHVCSESEQNIPPQRVTSISRPISPAISSQPKNKNDNGMIKKRTSSTRRTSTTQNKQLTKESLWENVDMFLKPVDNLNDMKDLLIDSKPIADQKWLQEPLGQHYSLTLRKWVNYSSDPLKEKLIVPQPPSVSSDSTNISTYLQSRLISSVVPKIGKETLQLPLNEPNLSIETNSNSFSKDVQFAESSVAPPSDSLDISGYSRLKYGDKLMLELKYIGIEIDEKVKRTEDFPIFKEMMYLFDQERECIDKTNAWKQKIREIFDKNMEYLEERKKKHNEWTLALSQIRQNDKTK